VAAGRAGKGGAAVTERALLLAALVAASGCGGPAAAPTPAIQTVDLTGLQVWLKAQRGNPVLLNYWATWCGPCVAELPDLLASTREFRAAGGIVAGVALELVVPNVTVEQAQVKVADKARELGLDFPLLLCTADDLIAAREALGIDLGALPQTFAYDRSGALVEQHEGIATREQFAALARAVQ
jgi:thiol-disulfide isomerase/thioredoxin